MLRVVSHLLSVGNTYVFLHRIQNQSLELVEAIVDSCTPPLLHNWLIALNKRRKNLLLIFFIKSAARESSRTKSLFEQQVKLARKQLKIYLYGDDRYKETTPRAARVSIQRFTAIVRKIIVTL